MRLPHFLEYRAQAVSLISREAATGRGTLRPGMKCLIRWAGRPCDGVGECDPYQRADDDEVESEEDEVQVAVFAGPVARSSVRLLLPGHAQVDGLVWRLPRKELRSQVEAADGPIMVRRLIVERTAGILLLQSEDELASPNSSFGVRWDRPRDNC